MPRKKRDEDYAPVGEKDIWHPYDLQQLVQRNFIKVVNKIIQGDYALMDTSHCASTMEY